MGPRRDADEKLMLLFTKPQTEAGKGYLRIDKNLWYYDPSIGKWERRTDRERIAGTDSRREDFDQSKLAAEYDPAFEDEEKPPVRVLKPTARFDSFVLWHPDIPVDEGKDEYLRSLSEWTNIASEVRAYVQLNVKCAS